MRKQAHIYLTDDLWNWLQEHKKKTGTTVAEIVRAALREYIKKQQDQESK